MDKSLAKFPKDFYWGASTASHQVEGGTHNQWSVWELANASELARTAEQRLGWLPNWDEIKSQAEDPENYVSGRGVEHYKRYKEDFKIAKDLNLNAFRFGIEWARLEPEAGKWDEEAVEHYRGYIAELRSMGIEPFLNIWHWTMPVWFADKGGFKKHSNLKHFDRFVQKIADEYGADLKFIITLNEPNVDTSFGYLIAEWVPEEKNILSFLKVYIHLTQAHKRAYRILKASNPNMQVGIATQLSNTQPANKSNPFNLLTAKVIMYFWNWWFLQRIRKYQDFVGFNYYFTDYFTTTGKRVNPSKPVNDIGFYMEPGGLHPLMVNVWKKYKKPIFITENGVADSADKYRQWWIEETMAAIARAVGEGVEVRGYFHWSLLDNFEWKYGWWPKFGLVEVDRTTMKRTVRPSARWFAHHINKID